MIIIARDQFQNLTEPMYYVLLSLLQERCGVEIMKCVMDISKKRVKVGPGTLYALLGRFEKDKLIKETSREGRIISYIITEDGKNVLKDEYMRLKVLVEEGKEFLEVEI